MCRVAHESLNLFLGEYCLRSVLTVRALGSIFLVYVMLLYLYYTVDHCCVLNNVAMYALHLSTLSRIPTDYILTSTAKVLPAR